MWRFEWFVSLLVYHYPCTYVAMYDDNRSIHITTLSGCQLLTHSIRDQNQTKISVKINFALVLVISPCPGPDIFIMKFWHWRLWTAPSPLPRVPFRIKMLLQISVCVLAHICKVYKLFYVITNSLSHNKTNWDNGLKNEFNLEITPGRCPVLGTTKISNKEILIRRVWGWTVIWQSGHMC